MRFEKGQSGNPGGRPKEYGEIRDLARQHTDLALQTLAEIAGATSQKPFPSFEYRSYFRNVCGGCRGIDWTGVPNLSAEKN
jgi:hypothetical protein